MTKLLISLLFVPLLAFAGRNDVIVNSENNTGTGFMTYGIHTEVDGIAVFNITSQKLEYFTFGTGLSRQLIGDQYALNVSNVPYSAITGAPMVSAAGQSGNYADLLGKPTLFSGNYADLAGKPTTCAGYGITDCLAPSAAAAAYYPLSSNPAGYLTSSALTPYLANSTAASTYAPKATTLAGYGITDGYSNSNPSGFVSQAGARNAISVTGAGGSYNSSTGVITINAASAGTTAIVGTTAKTGTFRVYQTGTITTAGTMVFQLTADGTSTGTALFPNETFTDSVQPIVNDPTSSYQFGWAFSNSNKTLTVTVNKLTTANLLTGVLGQAAAPTGTVVKLVVEGR